MLCLSGEIPFQVIPSWWKCVDEKVGELESLKYFEIEGPELVQ